MERYLAYTRSPWGSFLMALPLLALYQVAALLANLGTRRAVINGADALLQGLLNLVGLHGWLGTGLVLAVVAGVLAYRADPRHRREPLAARFFVVLLLESAVYAALFGGAVGVLTALLFPGIGFLQIGQGIHFGQKLAVSLGAGLYEELVFRVLLMGGVAWGLRRLGWQPVAAGLAALAASSLLFSLFHYVGPGGEPFALASFAFRCTAGAVLAGLYWVRGFAVTAWTHALYDLFLVLSGHA